MNLGRQSYGAVTQKKPTSRISFVIIFFLFTLGLLAGLVLQNFFFWSTSPTSSQAQYSSFPFTRDDLTQSDKVLQDSLGELHQKLSATLDSIAEKEALLNTTLDEVEVARRSLTQVIYISDSPLDPHLAIKGSTFESMAAEAAASVGLTAGNVQAVNLSAAVEEALLKKLEVHMPMCTALLSECEDKQRIVSERRQLSAQANREERLFNLIEGYCHRMDELKPWWEEQKLSWEEAKKRVKEGEGGQLEEYVFLHTLYEKHWNKEPGSKEHIQNVRAQKNSEAEAARNAFDESQRSFEACKGSLWEKCFWRLPRDKWRETHDEILANHTKRIEENGTCTDGGTPEERAALGLAAPYEVWKRDPELYPDRVNVTFVMQYYRRTPGNISTIVNRLYECTKGILGEGQLPGVTSQLVVNVDQADEMETWMDLWKATEVGEFLIPIFTHDEGLLRGWNNGARIAKGYVVVFLQDNVIPPEQCGWVSEILKAFDGWPRLGAVGMSTGKFALSQKTGEPWFITLERRSEDGSQMRMKDPKTKVRMQFSSAIGFTPSAVRRKAFVDMGGFDEVFIGTEGQQTEVVDRHMSIRMWLAGYQVAQMHTPQAFAIENVERAKFKVDIDNEWNNKVYSESVMPYEESVREEVKRMNGFLEVNDPWE